MLSGDAQRFAARRENAQVRTRLEQVGDDVGASVDYVLTVIKYQQEVPSGEKLAADDGADQRVICQTREFYEAHAVRTCCLLCGDLQRETRLADATRADQRHQRTARQQLLELNDGILAPHETGQLPRQLCLGSHARSRY